MALITVLLVFFLITIIASEIVSRVYFSIRHTGNQLIAAQAYQYALGGEAFARQLLYRDFELDLQDGAKDHPGEKWYKQAERYEFDQGVIEISISDLQGRLNVNNLITDAGETDPKRVAALKQLVSNQAADSGLVTAWVDWLDRDIVPGGIGTEDEGYLEQEPPYRSANRPMAHLSELLLTKGMERQLYEKIAPSLTVLPQRTEVNINTADEEVLKAMISEVDQTTAERIIEGRGESGYESLEAFTQHESMAGLTIDEGDFSVRSQYFEVVVRSQFAGREVWLRSILYRDAEKGIINLISRDRSGNFEAIEKKPETTG